MRSALLFAVTYHRCHVLELALHNAQHTRPLGVLLKDATFQIWYHTADESSLNSALKALCDAEPLGEQQSVATFQTPQSIQQQKRAEHSLRNYQDAVNWRACYWKTPHFNYIKASLMNAQRLPRSTKHWVVRSSVEQRTPRPPRNTMIKNAHTVWSPMYC